MSRTLAQVLVAVAITVAVWLLGGGDWPLLVMGAALWLSLWVMLLAGSWAGSSAGGPTWWAVGFIFAGVMLPSVAGATQRGSDDR